MFFKSRTKEEHYKWMTESPVPATAIELSLPAIVGTLITTVYNLVDTFYVGKLGTSQAAAIGVAYSIMNLSNAFGFLMGMGGGLLIGRLLGAKKPEEANVYASTAFFFTLAASSILAAFGIIFVTPLMRAMGATETNIGYAVEYSRVLLIAFPIMSTSLVLSTIIRCEGKTLYSMIGIGTGGVLAIALAPVFIFVFKLGVRGAALTDVVCQSISLLILLSFYLRGKSQTHLSVKNVNLRVLPKMIKTGFPSLCRHLTYSLANIAMNFSAQPFGDSAQAAMSIIMRLLNLSQALTNGMNQGAQTLFSFNYGAKRYVRVKEIFRFILILNTCVLAVIGITEVFLARPLVTLFRDDPAVIGIAAPGVRIQALGMLLIPLSTMPNMLFQSVGESWKSSFLAFARQGLFYIPLVLLLPKVLGILGLQCAMPLSDLITLCIAMPMLLAFFKKLNALIAEQKVIQS